MYFPYFRGKMFELVMLREVVDLVANNGNIIPIIEPVNTNTTALERTVSTYIERNAPFLLISNPYVGDLSEKGFDNSSSVIKLITPKNRNAVIGHIVSEKSDTQEIQTFIKRFNSYRLALVHIHPLSDIGKTDLIGEIRYNIFDDNSVGKKYQDSFKKSSRVLLKDTFKTRQRNKDYPSDEFFSDQHSTYKEAGFTGFGDFSIVGDRYYKTGGAPHAVAIHLPYLRDKSAVWIRHFISDRTEGQVDTPGKFLEALAKLVSFHNANRSALNYSSACVEYQKLYRKQHFPQLGFVKKLSMRHHIELMNTLVQ